MNSKRLGRREFLKASLASAAAAGLSHFRFLNFGGVGTALARDCEVPQENPDVCDAANTDWCIPGDDAATGDKDVCNPDPSLNGTDMCPDDSYLGDGDVCDPLPDSSVPDACAPDLNEFDVCRPDVDDPDVCIGDEPAAGGDGDQCRPDLGDADVCIPAHSPEDQCVLVGRAPEQDTCNGVPSAPAQDICVPPSHAPEQDVCIGVALAPEQADTCDPAGNGPDVCDLINSDPDVCEPLVPEPDTCDPQGAPPDPDICIGDAAGDGDVCIPEYTNPPDLCSPTFDPDVCDPPAGATDEPSPVDVSAFNAQPAAGGPAAGVGALSGLLAALGAAALWLRHRLGAAEPEKEKVPDAE